MQDIRTRLIEATFQEVFSNGYTGASLANILKRADTKKGSMYHHFPSKKDMVIAMIEDKVLEGVQNKWNTLAQANKNIIDTLISIIEDKKAWNLINGCALGNLLQESLNQDEDFAKVLNDILNMWKTLIANSLEKAAELGEIKKDIKAEDLSTFIIASIEGALLLTKKSQDNKDFEVTIKQLVFYINSYRV